MSGPQSDDRHVAERDKAMDLVVQADLWPDPYVGALFSMFVDGRQTDLIVVDPPRREGESWRLRAAPAMKVGRDAGTA